MRSTLARIARITAGVLHGEDRAVDGITTDSREVPPGALFVALAGEHFDGHDFVHQAMTAGAAGALVERSGLSAAPRIEVADTLTALLELAVDARSRIEVPVIGITGSTGKTSTKDMTAAAMGPGAWASPASYNNEIGVPLTVLGMPDDASSVTVEVGSRGRGHIAMLMPAVRPDVAVVTNLGLVHLETFGTTDDLAAAKGELVEGLDPQGTAVLPFGEDRLGFAGTEIRFGDDPAADVAVSGVTLDSAGRPSFVLVGFGERFEVSLAMAGSHQALNAAAAVAAAVAAGRRPADAVAGVSSAAGSPWRMEVMAGRFIVVNDAYNANPTSVESALRTTARLGEPRVAVLGVMAELGDVSHREHLRMGALARELGFDPIIVVGDAPGLAEGAGAVAVEVESADEALKAAIEASADGCAILVKGSRVVGLESVAARLGEEAQQ